MEFTPLPIRLQDLGVLLFAYRTFENDCGLLPVRSVISYFKSGVSKSNIHVMIRNLVQSGHLEVLQSGYGDDGRYTPTLYRITAKGKATFA